MHPGWIIEDAIVHSVRGRGRKRQRRAPARPKPPTYTATTYTAELQITNKETGNVREISCGHDHRTEQAGQECGQKMWRQWSRDHPGDTLRG
jgi:hypothetical protein